MVIRSHIDFFATLTPALVSAVSAEEGRVVGRDETAARLMRELRQVVERWTAYGEWVDRVESGAWLAAYQQRKDGATKPLRWRGRRACVRSTETRARMSEAMRASWAKRRASELRVAV
jgi:hypothetical protein